MSFTCTASTWALAMFLVIGAVKTASASSLTLGTAPGINHFHGDDWLISGATVDNGTPQAAAFEAFHWIDANDDGVWNGPDGQRRAIGSYDDGLFGLYSACLSLGAFNSAHQYVRTVGRLIVDDVIISTSDPTPPSTIPVTLSFHVSGETSHFNSASQPELITSELDMSIKINGAVFNGKYAWWESGGGSTETVTGLGTQIAGGSFLEPFSATVTTGSANVPVNAPFTLEVEFVITASTGGGSFSAYGGMTFDARNTVGFLPGAEIFNNLPAGYVASSLDVGIENNMFGGTTTSTPLAPRSSTEESSWGGIKNLFRD